MLSNLQHDQIKLSTILSWSLQDYVFLSGQLGHYHNERFVGLQLKLFLVFIYV